MTDSAQEWEAAYRKFIPRWDGNPSTWRRYKSEVQLWLAGEDVKVSYNLAARVIQNLSGSARRCALTLDLSQLEPRQPSPVDIPVPDDGETHGTVATSIQSRSDLCAGVYKLLDFLESSLQPGPATRKGSAMAEFFAKKSYWRRTGERISDYITRFDSALQDMREAGFDAEASPDLAGWWFVHMLGLTEERCERILSALPDESYSLPTLKKAALRLFADLHTAELQAQLQAPTSRRHDHQERSSAVKFSDTALKARSALETQAQGQTGVAEIANDDSLDVDPAEFQNACRQELDCLSLAIEACGGDFPSHMTSDEVATITDAATSLAMASEAMSTLRTARSALCTEQNKGKGKGKGDGPVIAPFVPRRGGRGRGTHYATLQQSIAQRKLRSHCNSCGGIGHWSGDSECPETSRDANGSALFRDPF